MGNRKAREYLLRRQEEEAWERTRTEERPASADVYASGIGDRRMQLIRCPAFEEGSAWEVRELADGWRAYRSRVVDRSGTDLRLVGYDPVPADSAALEACFTRLVAISLPLSPLNGRVGRDGTSYQFAAFDLFCAWRVQWWEELPPQWAGLARVVAELQGLLVATGGDHA